MPVPQPPRKPFDPRPHEMSYQKDGPLHTAFCSICGEIGSDVTKAKVQSAALAHILRARPIAVRRTAS